LGHPVDERRATFFVPLRYRVDDDAASEVAGDDHVAPGKVRPPHGDPAPHDDAVPARRSFVRRQCVAHHGVNAIAADQQVALVTDRRAAAGRRCELGGDPTVPLFESSERAGGMDAPGPEAIEYGAIKDAQQLSAVDRDLRPTISGVQSSRLAPDSLAVLR